MRRRSFILRLPVLYVGVLLTVLLLAALFSSNDTADDLATVTPLATAFPMTLPEYREDFTHYLTVDRPDGTVRQIFISPDALAAVAQGDDLPYGTQLVIEAYSARTNIAGQIQRGDDGRYIAGEMIASVHVMEKRDDWTQADLPSPIGVIDWNFAAFDPATGLPTAENRNDCMTCHDSGAFRRDFTFSRSLLQRFVQTGETQYLFCNRSGRANCIR